MPHNPGFVGAGISVRVYRDHRLLLNYDDMDRDPSD
jgi:hypothetical protein